MKVVHYIDGNTIKNHIHSINFHLIVLPFNGNYHLIIVLLSPNIHGVYPT
jgi:hypothetical protein